MEVAAGWLQGPPGAGEALGWLRLDLLGRLVLATLLGGAIGLERELSGKPAGLRTNILICVGAAVLTELSVAFTWLGGPSSIGDPSRIAAQIVSGIGFLGAGTIIQARGHVTGLTTAATLWVVAAIGMAVGGRAYVEAVGASALVIVTLLPLSRLERVIERRRRGRTLLLTVSEGEGALERVQEALERAGLDAHLVSLDKDPATGAIHSVFDARGREDHYRHARSVLVALEEVRGLRIE